MGIIKGNASPNTLNGTSGNDTIYGFGGNDTLKGMGGSDVLFGGSFAYDADTGNDYLDGGAGADSMYGGGGNDTYIVDNIGDKVYESRYNGYDSVYSYVNNYELPAFVERLELMGNSAKVGYGNSEDNYIKGNDMMNTLYGYDGNDTIDGGRGMDIMYGGTGNDLYYVDNESDTVVENEGEGIDTVIASTTESFRLDANVENLILSTGTKTGIGNYMDNEITGNSLANTLKGLDGNDTILGNEGDDTLIGGTGNDSLNGGSGNDKYQFSANDGIDVIQDSSGTDSIVFDTTVNKENVALYLDSNNNLFLDYGSSAGSDVVKVIKQTTNTIENVTIGDYTLSSTTINQLIQDMSAYATEQGLTISSVEDVKANAELMTMINNAWTNA